MKNASKPLVLSTADLPKSNAPLVVEVGLKLDNTFDFYDRRLKSNGLKNVFSTITHDIYFTNVDLSGLTENEIKNACIRLRSCNGSSYKIQNNIRDNLKLNEVSNTELAAFEKALFKNGYRKVFDTSKSDFHYRKKGLGGVIQLQQIQNIGLLVYYDNSDYYNFDLDAQRKLLIKDLNSCGFSFGDDVLGLDKLRTLYYKKEMYSKNQNG